MAARIVWSVGLAIAAMSCEASPHVHVKLRLPRGTTVDLAKLHVTDDARSEREFPPSLSRASVVSQELVADGIEVELGLAIGSVQYVFVHAWYDTDGNGAVNPGDLVGDLRPAPFEARDRGGCSQRDANRAPEIVLRPIALIPTLHDR